MFIQTIPFKFTTIIFIFSMLWLIDSEWALAQAYEIPDIPDLPPDAHIQVPVERAVDINPDFSLDYPKMARGGMNPFQKSTVELANHSHPDDQYFDDRFSLPGLDEDVLTATSYEEDLILGGSFNWYNGEVKLNHVARWDGTDLKPLGEGFNGTVVSLQIYNGDLIAAGRFTHSGDNEINRIARWDGDEWKPVGEGFNNDVLSLGVYEDDLIAGGWFSHSGSTIVNQIARWDGSNWIDLNNNWSNLVSSIEVYNGDLIAGGVFISSEDMSRYGVIRWDGKKWHLVGEGLEFFVRSLTVYQGDLIAGGDLTGISDDLVDYLARWDGDGWHKLGSGVNDIVTTVYADRDRLHIGGSFTMAGGLSSGKYAIWHKILESGLEQPQLVGPEDFALDQNYPNPFNPSTQIRFAIPEQSHVRLTVYNLLGQEVAQLLDETRSPGRHNVTFDATGLSSGMFIYRLEAEGYVETRQMMFVK